MRFCTHIELQSYLGKKSRNPVVRRKISTCQQPFPLMKRLHKERPEHFCGSLFAAFTFRQKRWSFVKSLIPLLLSSIANPNQSESNYTSTLEASLSVIHILT